MFQNEEIVPDLREFLGSMIDLVRPHVVIATGDLTDAKASNMRSTRQFEDEWKTYAQVLADTRVLNKTVWLDLRGNHDNFDVADANSNTSNLYKYFLL